MTRYKDKEIPAIPPPNYTQTPNVFYDSIMPQINSLAELKITLALIRNTFGWQKSSEKMSQKDLIKATNLSRNSVKTGVEQGVERGTIVIVNQYSVESNESAEYALNMHKIPKPARNKGRKKDLGQTLTEGGGCQELTQGASEFDRGLGQNLTEGGVYDLSSTKGSEHSKESFKETLKEEEEEEESFQPNPNFNSFESEIRRMYENTFSVVEDAHINKITEYLDDGLEPGVLLYVFEIAKKRNARDIWYVHDVIEKWQAQGVRTLADAKQAYSAFRKSRKRKRTQAKPESKPENKSEKTNWQTGIDFSKFREN